VAEHFTWQRRVEFCETDAAGIAHFSAFFQYMEQAEHALLRSLGTSVLTRGPSGHFSWPRVSAQCDYRGAVRFEEVLDIHVCIKRFGEKSITYGFTFMHGGAVVAEGQLVTVHCRVHDGRLESLAIPTELQVALKRFAE
jgi:4-hydroxybenzoyl-CoA thioesterase/acyl-CoA thioester hydrolase